MMQGMSNPAIEIIPEMIPVKSRHFEYPHEKFHSAHLRFC